MDEIHPEMLKALDIVGLSLLVRLFSVAWRLGTVPVDWQTGVVVPIFKKGEQRVCSIYWGITLLSLPGWRGGSGRLSDLRFRNNNAGSVLAVEQWTSSSPLQGYLRGHGSLHIQSTCALWTWRRLTTMSLWAPCGWCCGIMGYWGRCCELFGSYITAVRAVSAFLAVSQTRSQLVLGSARVVPCH